MNSLTPPPSPKKIFSEKKLFAVLKNTTVYQRRGEKCKRKYIPLLISTHNSPITLTAQTLSKYSSNPRRLESSCWSDKLNGHFPGSFGKLYPAIFINNIYSLDRSVV